MTNNHVLGDAVTAAHSQAEFNHMLGADGVLGPSVAFGLEPGTFFATDVALDFTVVAVAPRAAGRGLDEFGWNPLIEAEGKVILHELLNIVQHPNGEPKQVALRENRLVDLVENFSITRQTPLRVRRDRRCSTTSGRWWACTTPVSPGATGRGGSLPSAASPGRTPWVKQRSTGWPTRGCA